MLVKVPTLILGIQLHNKPTKTRKKLCTMITLCVVENEKLPNTRGVAGVSQLWQSDTQC